MKVYIIKQPYLGSTYDKPKILNKRLEVFECEYESGEIAGSSKFCDVEKLRIGDTYLFKTNIVHRYNNGRWVKKRVKSSILTTSNILTTSDIFDVKLSRQLRYDLCFSTLEMGKIIKLLMHKNVSIDCLEEIDRLKFIMDNDSKSMYDKDKIIKTNEFLKKINELKSLQEINDSNIEKPLKEIKNEYPEYFI